VPSGYTWSESDRQRFVDVLLQQSSKYGFVLFDADTRIRAWSHGAHHLTGFSEGDVLGQPGSILFVPEDVEQGMDRHEFHEAGEFGFSTDERWHARKPEGRFWSSGVTRALHDDAGQVDGFLKIFRDATHLRTRMKYLENVAQEARLERESLELQVGTVAHELRNPMAPLKMAASLLKLRLPDDPSLQQAVAIIDRQLDLLSTLVEDLVDQARLRAGKLRLEYGRHVLQDVVRDAISAVAARAAEQGITLHEAWPDVPLVVEVDAGRLHQVLVNLIGNAIKYTPAGGDVWITGTADQSHFLVRVRDNGQGIDATLLPQVFDAFTQAHAASTARGSGIGLGLALVKQLVTLHQGSAEVRSAGPGKGSEFIVRIPVRRPHGESQEPMPRWMSDGFAGRP
jgi:PAS domain S-box-containing protein